ncbi:hypothetical protein Rsub_00569 [Raphidocelis subcapitata]|uniref:Uncharacterized protein n=1 Tax=Raphidocelis subcapitata TaxID=307507 RepID=A0A2V0NSE7_9CHLO|nr:hypothetical protein Rsub_00569 [Raphidocelis subcapitata]|eukprot:GBF87857.1 hypothetical protein Rsub_00569 [Raphidocelis subcapitata]
MLRRALSSSWSPARDLLRGGAAACGSSGAGAAPAAAAAGAPPPRPPLAGARPLTTSSSPAAAAEVTAASETERAIGAKIAGGLPGAKSVRVEDTSGGCGTMYAIEVVAADFEGQSKIKQHQLVAKLIADDVKQWHGFQLVTKLP